MPHIHDLIDFTVEVFIVFEDKVLLRKHDKLGIWLSVGGHVELNEDPNEAAVREVKEEVGLKIELDDSARTFNPENPDYPELIPPHFLNRHSIDKNHQHITFVYFAKAKTMDIIPSESEKSEDIKWFIKQELMENTEILENIKYYALSALEQLNK